MKSSGDFSLSNLSLVHWIGESNPLIDDGLPGIFPESCDLPWSLELHQTCFFSCYIFCPIGSNFRVFHRQRTRILVIKNCRTTRLHPICNPGDRVRSSLYFHVCKTCGTNPCPLWNIRIIGCSLCCKKSSVFQPHRSNSNDAGGKGTGGSSQSGRSKCLGAIHQNPLSTHQKRIYFRIFINLHHHYA